MTRTSARGMALLITLLAIAIASLALAGLQAISFRQAAAGRETVARLRAYWAARAGLEETIARYEHNLQTRDPGSFFTLPDDLVDAATGVVPGGSWRISHDDGTDVRSGPADPHARVNINRMSRDDLLTLDGMTEDVADAILDWADSDDDPRELGAEVGYYSSLPSPYEPRNAPMQSLFELELVAGVDPQLVRGEDWNLNGIVDPNENDGDLSWPPDNEDGILDAGWSAVVTAASMDAGLTATGNPRLTLRGATPDVLIERVPSIDLVQAAAIIDYAGQEGTRIEQLINTQLSALAQQNVAPGNVATPVRDLDDDQLRELLAEATFEEAAAGPIPGRININTVSLDALDHVTAISPGLADVLILSRDSSATGYTNLMDLLEIPAITRGRLVNLSQYIGVESGAYAVTSVGRDDATGVEVQIVATLSSRALPLEITEMRTR